MGGKNSLYPHVIRFVEPYFHILMSASSLLTHITIHTSNTSIECLPSNRFSSEAMDECVKNIPLRTSEVSLSVLVLHLLNCWLDDNREHRALFWVLMRALRDHHLPQVASENQTIFSMTSDW